MFSGSIERDQWHKMSYDNKHESFFKFPKKPITETVTWICFIKKVFLEISQT